MEGVVEAVFATMVDVSFPEGRLPRLRDALRVLDGTDRMLEVQAHVGHGTVRALSLEAAAGLRRGVRVEALGEPLRIPVGPALLGRVVDCLGRPLDGGPQTRARAQGQARHVTVTRMFMKGSVEERIKGLVEE